MKSAVVEFKLNPFTVTCSSIYQCTQITTGLVCLRQVNGYGGGSVAGVSGGQMGGYHSTVYPELGACDIMADIQNQLNELSLADANDADTSQSSRCRAARKPPSTYLCHLCFQKGHFIKDCPQVYRVSAAACSLPVRFNLTLFICQIP